MKKTWEASNTYIGGGAYLPQVYRRLDPSKPDHAGNRVTIKREFKSLEEAKEYAMNLNDEKAWCVEYSILFTDGEVDERRTIMIAEDIGRALEAANRMGEVLKKDCSGVVEVTVWDIGIQTEDIDDPYQAF